jgi:hypothetical protein
MSPKAKKDPQIPKLVKCLVDQDRRKALSTVRKRLGDPFDNEYQELFWKGLERALYRSENDALITRLVNGLSKKEAKHHCKEITKKKKEILIRDHTKVDVSSFYLHYWEQLLDSYCELSPE